MDFAVRALPLKEFTSGPKGSLRFGPEFIKHMPLGYLMNILDNYPGKGEQLVIKAFFGQGIYGAGKLAI